MTCPYILCWIFLGIISAAVVISIYRAIAGPTVSDRIVALDVMTNITIILLVLLGFIFQRFVYLDVALIYGILSFIGVVVAARYLEGGLGK